MLRGHLRARTLVGIGIGLGLCGHASAAALSAPTSPVRGTAVVTGGSRGIGAACSRKLAAKGYSVVVVYRSGESEANEVVDGIAATGGRAVAMQADVGEEADVVGLFKRVDSWRGSEPLTALVNNAGVLGPKGVDGGLPQLDSAKMMDVLRVNTIGPALCIREAESRMSTAQGHTGGAIVQVSSGSAYIGTPLIYACSKGALNSLTIGLVGSLAKQGIRINTISPGMTATDMIAETLPTFDMSNIPLGRVGTPDEIADCVAWLCSDEASYVAGANVRIAGGRPPGTTLG